MAALVKGPISSSTEPGLTIEVPTLLAWINSLLVSSNTQFYRTAKSAIGSLLTYNFGNQRLFDEVIRHCYVKVQDLKIQHEYFLAIVDFVSTSDVWHSAIAKIICLAIYQIGNEAKSVRRGAAAVTQTK
jgi:hypothetical protein